MSALPFSDRENGCASGIDTSTDSTAVVGTVRELAIADRISLDDSYSYLG